VSEPMIDALLGALSRAEEEAGAMVLAGRRGSRWGVELRGARVDEARESKTTPAGGAIFMPRWLPMGAVAA
jgi:hypothetical protein